MMRPLTLLPTSRTVHETIDRAGVTVGSLFVKKYFRDGVTSPSIEDHLAAIDLDLPELYTEGEYDLDASTLVGDLSASVRLAQWVGPNAPTIIYHHGAGEVPYDTSFDRLFPTPDADLEANLIAVRAPFHQSTAEFSDGNRTLSNVVAAMAVSVRLVELLVRQLRERGDGPVLVAGTSLGGFIANVHYLEYGSADVYTPLLAGLAMDHVFLDSVYAKGVARRALSKPDAIRAVLNFEASFDSAAATNVFPLLARFDAIVDFDVQQASYGDVPVATINRGHLTGALAAGELRVHVTSHLP